MNRLSADTAHANAVLLIVVACREHTVGVEVHIVRVGRTVLLRRPIVSACTVVVQRTVRAATEADSGKNELSAGLSVNEHTCL